MKHLVCLHAAGSSPATWDHLKPALVGLGYRVHTPTLLGHGSAERRTAYPLDAFADHVLKEIDGRFTLIGASLGAFVATLIAQREPDRIDRLVLEELPVPRRTSDDDPPSNKRGTGLVLRAMGLLNRGRFDPAMLRQIVAELHKPRPQWWAALPTITAPTLLLAGGTTSHLDQSRFALVAKELPASTVTTIEAGHRIHSKAPDRWLAAVSPFIG
ncbi:alpha/beta hydrolase [Kribbella sp. NBC_00382]|uniref:alpha/beta fold hydrolase n=1 Tax=Kribbella sp. NBC_00382 TaxID=2975967 RepID=UPI002E20826D